MDDTSAGGPSRDENGRFLPGHGGRPRGARNLMSKRIAMGVLRHYEEHEPEILEQLRRAHTVEFMRLVGRVAAIGPEDVLEMEPLPPDEAARRAELEAVAAEAERDAWHKKQREKYYGPQDGDA